MTLKQKINSHLRGRLEFLLKVAEISFDYHFCNSSEVRILAPNGNRYYHILQTHVFSAYLISKELNEDFYTILITCIDEELI